MKLRRRWTTGWRQDFLRLVVFVATIPLVFPLSTLRAAEPYTIEMAQQANSNAYGEFTKEYRNLQVSMAVVRTEIDTNEAEREAFVVVSEQHAVLLDEIYEEAPKLTEAFRLLLEDAMGVEIVSVRVVQLSESNYALVVQVNCAASQLPGLLKKLNVSILIGQLISLGIGIGIGSAIGGGASASASASAGGHGGGFGSVNGWTGAVGAHSVNGWTGAVGAHAFAHASASASASSFIFPLLIPFGMGGGGGQTCVGGSCVAQPPAATCVECVEGQSKKTCVDCDEKDEKKGTFCPDCKLPLKYGTASPSQTSPTSLTPIPEPIPDPPGPNL